MVAPGVECLKLKARWRNHTPADPCVAASINRACKTSGVCRVNATSKFEHSDPALKMNFVTQWVARRVRRYGVATLGKDYGHYPVRQCSGFHQLGERGLTFIEMPTLGHLTKDQSAPDI